MQVFHRSTNTLSKVTLIVVLVLVGGGLSTLRALQDSPYLTDVQVVRTQPVPFSHEHHAGGLGIDCRYCHTSVEESNTAGMPASSVCMNCHAQIWADAPMLAPVRESFKTGKPIEWTRVHDLPDFVFFNHGVHVRKGIGCVSCHGRVDKMPLMWKEASLNMAWCLECHRNPGKFVMPKGEVTKMDWHPPADRKSFGDRLVGEYHIKSRTDCYACHR